MIAPITPSTTAFRFAKRHSCPSGDRRVYVPKKDSRLLVLHSQKLSYDTIHTSSRRQRYISSKKTSKKSFTLKNLTIRLLPSQGASPCFHKQTSQSDFANTSPASLSALKLRATTLRGSNHRTSKALHNDTGKPGPTLLSRRLRQEVCNVLSRRRLRRPNVMTAGCSAN